MLLFFFSFFFFLSGASLAACGAEVSARFQQDLLGAECPAVGSNVMKQNNRKRMMVTTTTTTTINTNDHGGL